MSVRICNPGDIPYHDPTAAKITGICRTDILKKKNKIKKEKKAEKKRKILYFY